MSAEKLHSYMLPTGRRLVIREMKVSEIMRLANETGARIAVATSKGDTMQTAMADAASWHADARRRASLVQIGDRRVSTGQDPVSVADLLDSMSGPEMDCLDLAIRDWSDASEEVLRDFRATCDQEEAPPAQAQRVPRVVTQS